MEILAFKGLVLGFIYSVALVSGTVWCAQVTLKRGLAQGLAVAVAISLGQCILGGFALLALYGLLILPMKLGFALRVLAVVVFVYMSYKMFVAPKATTLQTNQAEGTTRRLFVLSLALAVTMPMRLGGYLAFSIAAGLPYHGLSAISVPMGAIFIGIGSFVWFGYIVILARAFGHRVPERISLRSINKLNPLSGVVFFLVALISFLPLLAR